MAVEVDILEGTATSHDILRGWEITRIAIVTGLQSIATVTLTGTTSASSSTVTMASTIGVLLGMSVAGTGIPVPCRVAAVTPNTSVTLTVAATATGTVSLVFGSTDTMGLTIAAEAAVIAVTGDRGTICPNVGVPTYLKTFQPELIGVDAAKVKIVYSGYPLPTYEFDGGLNNVETNMDVNSSLLTMTYTYPINYPYDYKLRGQTITQGGMINRPVSENLITVRWVITAGNINGTPSNATQIMAWFKAFQDRVNNASYTIGYLTGAAHTWLVEKVSGISRDGGTTYEAAMTFHYKENTWDQLIWFKDPNTGMPPPDLISGTGYKMARAIAEAALPTFTFPPN
jgi:hypothetical protein